MFFLIMFIIHLFSEFHCGFLVSEEDVFKQLGAFRFKDVRNADAVETQGSTLNS